MNIKVNDSKDPVAEQDSLLVQVDYANQPIPNNRLPKGLYYSFKNKWVDMITLLTPAIKKIITANTTVPAWGSITGTLSNQTDLQSALDNKMSSDLTDSHIFVGDATNKATDVEMTGDVTIDNTGATTLANTSVTAGTYGNSTNVPQIVVDSKGRITGASNVGVSISGALGYTPEDVSNKATSLTSPDNTKYPTTLATQTALDLKANKSEVATVLFKSITQTIVTGKTAETCIYAIPLPRDGFNYMINVYSQAQVTTFLGLGITQRFRVGSFASPIDGTTGTNAIGLQTLLATNGVASANQIPLKRNFTLYGGASGSIYGLATGGNIPDDANTLWSFTSLASKDFTVQNYLYVTFNPSNVGAVVQHNQILVTAIKI